MDGVDPGLRSAGEPGEGVEAPYSLKIDPPAGRARSVPWQRFGGPPGHPVLSSAEVLRAMKELRQQGVTSGNLHDRLMGAWMAATACEFFDVDETEG
ncbi:hypothetical protein Kisp02_53990 [Kineosporia sp. NBRC 101731]|nr:hypothetical protein Kisp02_53990 [Kineosporia sp. NBRC 101731]